GIVQEGPEKLLEQEHLEKLLTKHVGPLDGSSFAHSGIPFKPAEILDPAGELRRSFCGDDEHRANSKTRYEDFKKTLNPKEAATPSTVKSLDLLRRTYGFPVFNAGYSKAALVACGEKETVFAHAEGPVFSHDSACSVV